MKNNTEIINSIPLSASDKFLSLSGLSMIKENIELVEAANFRKDYEVYDFATGGGRMTAILTRLGYNVVTGDISFELKQEAEERVTETYLKQVKFMHANLEDLPFESGSIHSLVSVNTFHHLENAEACLDELFRVQAKGGKFLLIDFTDKGYDLMDEHHMNKNGHLHTRGNYSWIEIGQKLKDKYQDVKEITKTVNRAFLAEGKK